MLIAELIRKTSINSEDLVVEIGSGYGHITKELAKKCRWVEAYELDETLYKKGKERLDGFKNIRLHRGDFLRATLPRITPYKVFSNIPFSKTSQIMRKLFCGAKPPKEAWMVLEKGAALRFMRHSIKNMDALFIQPFFEGNIVHRFCSSQFHPKPAVPVVLLHLKEKTPADLARKEQHPFVEFVKRCVFAGRVCGLSQKQVKTALRLAKLPDLYVHSTPFYAQWLCLFRCYRRFYKKA